MLDSKRREFIALLGGGGLLLAVKVKRARGQQPAMPVIGFLHDGSFEPRTHLVAAFGRGLDEAGFVDRRDVLIEYHWAQDQSDRLPAMAAHLVQRQVAVIATPGSPKATVAAKAATREIPIVFGIGTDPVKLGLVSSLNRPGGNVTGVSYFTNELGPKRLIGIDGWQCRCCHARQSEERHDRLGRAGGQGCRHRGRPAAFCIAGEQQPRARRGVCDDRAKG